MADPCPRCDSGRRPCMLCADGRTTCAHCGGRGWWHCNCPAGRALYWRGRRPGRTWRLLAWEGRGRARVEMQDRGTFDELVVDDWLHIEQMDARTWWMQVGDARVGIHIDRQGRATVTVQRGEYGEQRGEGGTHG